MSVSTAVLLILLVVAAGTDIARHRIPNWLTYPGMLAGLALNGVEGGGAGLEDAVKGFLVCGIIMLVCFVLFAQTGIGGGDVKLIAMMGAFLGIELGVEAMLWTFILGGVFGVAMVFWRVGFVNVVARAARHLRLVLLARSWVPPAEEDRKELQRWLFLAPSGLAAVCLILVDQRWPLFPRGS